MSGYRPDDDWSKEEVTEEARLATKGLLQGLATVLLIWIVAAAIIAALAGGLSGPIVAGTGFFVGLPALYIWKIIQSLRSGVATLKGGEYSRNEEPVWFWICVALFGAIALMPWGFAGYAIWHNW